MIYLLPGCKHEFYKKPVVKTKMIFGEKAYVCPKCGYYNSVIKKIDGQSPIKKI